MIPATTAAMTAAKMVSAMSASSVHEKTDDACARRSATRPLLLVCAMTTGGVA